MNKTALHDEHVKLGGKIVDFNGWALPVQFSGIVNEHNHTRNHASLFDCSHMGEYHLQGAAAIEHFNREVVSNTYEIPLGRCRYGAILNEDGGIIDDIITFRMDEKELYVVTNAGPLEAVTRRLCEGVSGAEHVSYETAKIDIQGPDAQARMLEAGFTAAESLKYFNATWSEWEGKKVLVSRTGYTGELGYELYMENDLAATVWNRFNEMDYVEPAGLGARDTLRLEVGYPLSGQDFDTSVTPLDLAMESFVAWDTDFVGKAALEAQRHAGTAQAFVAVQSPNRRAPRHDFEVFSGDESVGIVTSGTFGPSVGYGIGLARVQKQFSEPGTQLTAGPKKMELEVTTVPFYKDGTCRKKL